MKAIQFGAGNIGRGFIGAVLAEAGYEVIFADVVEELLNQINERKAYTVHVILKFVAPTIAKGLKARKEKNVETPLNVIACENGIRATSQLKELVFAQLDEDTAAWAKTHVGFPDAAVDRIVPPVHCEVPLDVAVEEFDFVLGTGNAFH